jgi:hypothetical protein
MPWVRLLKKVASKQTRTGMEPASKRKTRAKRNYMSEPTILRLVNSPSKTISDENQNGLPAGVRKFAG